MLYQPALLRNNLEWRPYMCNFFFFKKKRTFKTSQKIMILNSSWGYYVLSTPTPLKLLLHFTCIIKRIRKYLRKDPATRKARASGAPIAKKICLSIYPRNFGTHVIVRPPPYPVRSHHWNTNVKSHTF